VGKYKAGWKCTAEKDHDEFEVLTAVTMRNTVFGDVTLCSLVEIYRRIGGSTLL
jgi:hypothetical protein